VTAAIEITDATWEAEVVGRDEPILVDFWAPWCVPCDRIEPAVDEVAGRYAGRMAVGKLNVDDHPRSAGRYDVLSLPTLILFKGGEQVARLVGVVRAGDIEDAISPHVS
jgi:thioredoxin 1